MVIVMAAPGGQEGAEYEHSRPGGSGASRRGGQRRHRIVAGASQGRHFRRHSGDEGDETSARRDTELLARWSRNPSKCRRAAARLPASRWARTNRNCADSRSGSAATATSAVSTASRGRPSRRSCTRQALQRVQPALTVLLARDREPRRLPRRQEVPGKQVAVNGREKAVPLTVSRPRVSSGRASRSILTDRRHAQRVTVSLHQARAAGGSRQMPSAGWTALEPRTGLATGCRETAGDGRCRRSSARRASTRWPAGASRGASGAVEQRTARGCSECTVPRIDTRGSRFDCGRCLHHQNR